MGGIIDYTPLSADTPSLDSVHIKKGVSSSTVKNDSNKVKVYDLAEQQPTFLGGEEGLQNYLKENTHYPKEAKEKNIQGTVYVSFIVNQEGNIQDVNIVISAHPLLDAEAARVIASMPEWVPGQMGGKNVNVRMNIPIRFTLSSGKKKKR